MPKRSRNGLVSRPERVVAPTKVNFGEVDLHRARGRAFTDDQIELVVLHRRIENFLDGGAEPVNFVDEQDVPLFEVGQQGREIAGLGNHRAGRRAEADAHLLGHDLRERRLAETGRAGEQHVIEGVAAALGSLNEDPQVGPRALLPDELVERLRADRRFERVGFLSDA